MAARKTITIKELITITENVIDQVRASGLTYRDEEGEVGHISNIEGNVKKIKLITIGMEYLLLEILHTTDNKKLYIEMKEEFNVRK